MPMLYKSPGRALRDLRGINTGHYGKKWSIMKKMAPNFNTFTWVLFLSFLAKKSSFF